MKIPKTILVNTFTGGLVGPSIPMIGPVADGGTIIAETAPGCWGPMITPSFKGGHEVTSPVAVDGAVPGDAIAIRIKKVRVTSIVTSSGTMGFVEGRFTGDPFVARNCPDCGTKKPSYTNFLTTRLRPFIGNIGTTPAIDMPDSHNAGDFGQFLLGAPHDYGITSENWGQLVF